jgi:hypothetical protein
MAIELQVLIQVVDSDSGGIMFKGEKITSAVAPDGTPIEGCFAVAKAKLATTVSEVEKDVAEQVEEAERSI